MKYDDFHLYCNALLCNSFLITSYSVNNTFVIPYAVIKYNGKLCNAIIP